MAILTNIINMLIKLLVLVDINQINFQIYLGTYFFVFKYKNINKKNIR